MLGLWLGRRTKFRLAMLGNRCCRLPGRLKGLRRLRPLEILRWSQSRRHLHSEIGHMFSK